MKSTGPKTDSGKLIASLNAVKHGLLSKKALIPGESETEFVTFSDEWLQKLKPIGGVECYLAQRIISISWRLCRVFDMESSLSSRENALEDPGLFSNLAKVSRYESALERMRAHNLKELKQMQAQRADEEVFEEELRNEANLPDSLDALGVSVANNPAPDAATTPPPPSGS